MRAIELYTKDLSAIQVSPGIAFSASSDNEKSKAFLKVYSSRIELQRNLYCPIYEKYLEAEKAFHSLRKELGVWSDENLRDTLDGLGIDISAKFYEVLKLKFYHPNVIKKHGRPLSLNKGDPLDDTLLVKINTGLVANKHIHVYPPKNTKSLRYHEMSDFRANGQINMFVMKKGETAMVRHYTYNEDNTHYYMLSLYYDGINLVSYHNLVEKTGNDKRHKNPDQLIGKEKFNLRSMLDEDEERSDSIIASLLMLNSEPEKSIRHERYLKKVT